MIIQMPRFDQAQVLVIGDVMLDRYWYGATRRISPEAPVPVVKVEHMEERPGGAGNVALNIATLGAGVRLLGATGDDAAADALQASLEAARVYCDFHRDHDFTTITKLRIVSRNQQLIRMDFEEPANAGVPAALLQRAEVMLKAAQQNESDAQQRIGALVLSDYAKGSVTQPQQLIALARAAGIPVLVDPKGNSFEAYRGATLLTPNLGEFEAVVGPCRDEAELVSRAQQLIRELDLQALLITRSERGMTLVRLDQPEYHLPARAREVFDVTGAGDTVISTVAAALAAGEPLAGAVALANVAAGIVVGKLGTAAVSAPELRRALQQEGALERGVLSVEQLLIAMDSSRASGEKIVFTNGCFDIIHAGHVGYLEQARKLGQRLIVAVNSDASVRRLKGDGRPINPVDRRMAVLAGLEAVDWVISFDEDTPENLLRALRPDVLVKGGDYDKQGVVGWEIVEAYGGEVKALDFLDDCSTTAIVNKIRS